MLLCPIASDKKTCLRLIITTMPPPYRTNADKSLEAAFGVVASIMLLHLCLSLFPVMVQIVEVTAAQRLEALHWGLLSIIAFRDLVYYLLAYELTTQ